MGTYEISLCLYIPCVRKRNYFTDLVGLCVVYTKINYFSDVVGLWALMRVYISDVVIRSCKKINYFSDVVGLFVRNSNNFSDVAPKLRQYFDGNIEPQLRNNMEVGCAGWMNNACKSMNHVLKQRTQWRLQHLPELIDKCRALVDAQYNEADRALLGLGDYHLQPTYARHRQTLSRWQTMSEWQRQHVMSDCFQLQLPTAK